LAVVNKKVTAKRAEGILFPVLRKAPAVRRKIMRPLFLIVLCYLSTDIYAQNSDTGYYNLIHKNIRSIQKIGIFFYSDMPDKEIYASFLKELPYALKTLKEKGIDLNKKEIDTLLRKLRNMATERQPSNMFPMSMRISSDSIIPHVEKIVRIAADSLIKLSPKDWAINNYWSLPWAFYFTNPIYLRGGTICFGYFMYYRTSAGQHGLDVNTVQNMELIRVATVGGGAW